VQGILRRYWHPVARSADIRDRPVPVTLLDQPVVLFRAGDEIVALRDLCIHRGAPLSLGWLDNGGIVCAYHGWGYGPDGACVRIPSLPEGKTIPRKARAQRYLVEQRYGLVWVCLEDEPAQPVPPYPPYDDTARATTLYEAFRWKANAARVCENVLDFTHLPWVHDGMLGSRQHPVYPHVEPRVHQDGISYDLPDEANDSVRHYRVYAPFTVSLDVRSNRPDGHNYWMLFTCAPSSSRETVQWFFTARDWDRHHPDHDWEVFDAIVMEQDRHIVENQRPEELPLDLSEELHLRGSDAGTLAYRRFLRELGVAWHH
jgi:phenylpropionate dioxygenase-like ring-hydroxylating dioxygenase large terminal subunit